MLPAAVLRRKRSRVCPVSIVQQPLCGVVSSASSLLATSKGVTGGALKRATLARVSCRARSFDRPQTCADGSIVVSLDTVSPLDVRQRRDGCDSRRRECEFHFHWGWLTYFTCPVRFSAGGPGTAPLHEHPLSRDTEHDGDQPFSTRRVSTVPALYPSSVTPDRLRNGARTRSVGGMSWLR